MHKRRLGRTSLQIAPLVFGGNVFGWTADAKTSFDLLDRFLEAGLNAIDTADVYSAWAPGNKGGESETIVGDWMKSRGNREKVIVVTKVGSPMGPGKKGLSAPYIAEAVEASLKRLKTDYIDLYLSHWPDPDIPYEETLGAYRDLVQQGKVRAIGASNYEAARLVEALDIAEQQGLPRYESLQPLYNLYDRADYENNLEAICKQRGLGVVTYFSLASGFLTGKYRTPEDLKKGGARGGFVARYLTPRGDKILSTLDEIAASHRSAPASVALAWLMARPSVTAPIASATSSSQLKTLTDAAQLHLEPASIEALDRASA